MRSLTFFILMSALAATLFAQQETLVTFDDETNGFGGPVVKFTTVNGHGAVIFGGRGGWIFNHSLIIGGGLYTLVSEVDAAADILPAQGPLDIDFSYFGFEIEHILRPSELVHYSLYGFIGAGTVRLLKDPGSFSKDNTQVEETDLAFVFEPTANAELNLTTWCRVMAGISYRITTGVSQIGLTNRDFTGLTASLTVKLGSF